MGVEGILLGQTVGWKPSEQQERWPGEQESPEGRGERQIALAKWEVEVGVGIGREGG